MINPDNHINIQNEFIELIKREFDGDITDISKVVKWLFIQGWLDPYLAKKVIIKKYYEGQLKPNNGNVRESMLDAAIAFDVTSSHVRDVVYRLKKIK